MQVDTDRFVELAFEGLLVTDPNHIVQWANPKMATLIDYSLAEIIGKPFNKFVHPDDLDRISNRLDEIAALPNPESFNARFMARRGYVVHTEISSSIHDDGSLYITVRDISNHVRDQQDLERLKSELQQFTYIVSHDLKEPTRMVLSFLNLFVEDYGDELDEDAKTYIDFARDGARRMESFVDDLMTYASAGRERPVTQVSMDGVLKDVKRTLGLVIEETGAVITSDPLPVVCSDVVAMRHVMLNLLTNAMKFSPDGPVIHVSAIDLGTHFRMSVKDSGLGFDPADHDRLFRVFERLHRKQEITGTGVGLAICKRLVERLDGRIWATSNKPGATFYFTAPSCESLDERSSNSVNNSD